LDEAAFAQAYGGTAPGVPVSGRSPNCGGTTWTKLRPRSILRHSAGPAGVWLFAQLQQHILDEAATGKLQRRGMGRIRRHVATFQLLKDWCSIWTF